MRRSRMTFLVLSFFTTRPAGVAVFVAVVVAVVVAAFRPVMIVTIKRKQDV